MNDLGRLLIVLGVVIAMIGVVMITVGRLPWLGRLPGDIHVERGNWSFHFPIVTSLLLSLVLTVILYFIGRR